MTTNKSYFKTAREHIWKDPRATIFFGFALFAAIFIKNSFYFFLILLFLFSIDTWSVALLIFSIITCLIMQYKIIFAPPSDWRLTFLLYSLLTGIVLYFYFFTRKQVDDLLKKNNVLYYARELSLMPFFTTNFVLSIVVLFSFIQFNNSAWVYIYSLTSALLCYYAGWRARYFAISLSLFNTGGIIIWLSLLASMFNIRTHTNPIIKVILKIIDFLGDYSIFTIIPILFCIPGIIIVWYKTRLTRKLQ